MPEAKPTSIQSSSQKGMHTHRPSVSRSRRDTPSVTADGGPSTNSRRAFSVITVMRLCNPLPRARRPQDIGGLLGAVLNLGDILVSKSNAIDSTQVWQVYNYSTAVRAIRAADPRPREERHEPAYRNIVTALALASGVALPGGMVGKVQAAELQVLAGGAMTAPLKEITAQLRESDRPQDRLPLWTTPELIKLATTGGPFDLGVIPREVLKDAAAQARFVSGPTTDIARVGLGVAVRSGAPKPDISTPEALKQTLLRAQSIASIPESAAGAQVLRAFERLGISEAMKAKLKAQKGPAQVVQAVAQGEAELGVFLINVLTAPGLDVVGPLPADLQQEVVFTAAVAADSKEADAAKAFIAYLTTPAATTVIRAKGMTPG